MFSLRCVVTLAFRSTTNSAPQPTTIPAHSTKEVCHRIPTCVRCFDCSYYFFSLSPLRPTCGAHPSTTTTNDKNKATTIRIYLPTQEKHPPLIDISKNGLRWIH